MDSKCVFVCGIGKVLMRNRIDQIEAGIIGHVRRWGPNYRIVIRVDSGHAFIFFEYESHKNAFSHEEGGTNSSNRTIVLTHLKSPGHRSRVATKRAHAAAAARSQCDTSISQSDEGIVYSLPTAPSTSPAPSALSQAPLRGTYMHHRIVQHATPLLRVTQHRMLRCGDYKHDL